MIRKQYLLASLFSVSLLFGGSLAFAQEAANSDSAGAAQPKVATPTEKRFIVIKPTAQLQVDSKVTGALAEGALIQVDSINGDWLWVTNQKAYLPKTDALPINEAISYYSKRLEAAKDPKDALKRARIYRIGGNTDSAIKDVEWAVKQKADVETLMLRGVLLQDKRDFAKSIQSYNDALALVKNVKEEVVLPDLSLDKNSHILVKAPILLLNNRGWALCEKGDYAAALADFDQVAKLDPKYARAIYNRGLTLERKGEPQKSIEVYNEVIKLLPMHADSYNSRGRVKFSLGLLDEANADFEAAIQLDTLHPQAYANRRSVWHKQKEWEKIATELEQQAKQSNPSRETLNSLAWFRATCPEEKYRDGKQATELATKICQATQGKEAGYLDTLAAAFAEAGKFEKAIEAEKRALGIASETRKKDYENRLALYQKQQAYRVP